MYYDERKIIPWWIVGYTRRARDNRIPGDQENFHLVRRMRVATEEREFYAKEIEELKKKLRNEHDSRNTKEDIQVRQQWIGEIDEDIWKFERERRENLKECLKRKEERPSNVHILYERVF